MKIFFNNQTFPVNMSVCLAKSSIAVLSVKNSGMKCTFLLISLSCFNVDGSIVVRIHMSFPSGSDFTICIKLLMSCFPFCNVGTWIQIKYASMLGSCKLQQYPLVGSDTSTFTLQLQFSSHVFIAFPTTPQPIKHAVMSLIVSFFSIDYVLKLNSSAIMPSKQIFITVTSKHFIN